MKNAVSNGLTLDFTAAAAIASGDMVQVGTQLIVAVDAVANGAEGVGNTHGVYTLPCLSTDVITVGESLYWDDGNSRLTVTAAGNQYAGKAWSDSPNGTATVNCNINIGGKDVAG